MYHNSRNIRFTYSCENTFKGHLYYFLCVPAAQCFKIPNDASSVIVVPTKVCDIVKSNPGI